MRPKNNLPWDLDQGMTMFQVRPDWYEDYWLKPSEPAGPGETRSRGRKIAACAIFAGAISFALFTTSWTRHDSQAPAMRADAASVNSGTNSALAVDGRRHSGQR